MPSLPPPKAGVAINKRDIANKKYLIHHLLHFGIQHFCGEGFRQFSGAPSGVMDSVRDDCRILRLRQLSVPIPQVFAHLPPVVP
jgi:hypothetical protein